MSFWEILDTLFLKPLYLLFEVIYVMADKVIGNPGVSIIVLSLFMNFLVLPLYMRADKIQEEEHALERKLQKGAEHIKKTFSGDERMMMLQTYYRQNNYKPVYVLRSAVSLLLQIPFFIAAYRFLSGLQLLSGVSFGPIPDLGMPDGILQVAGISVNVLPVIMTVVNLISCVIFTKGSPLKAKVQLYVMALFFLVFLYSSPAGLVFYWTLNNVFSLAKTIFYKLKNPGRVVSISFSIIGILLIFYGFFLYPSPTLRKKIFFMIMSVLMQIPLISINVKERIKKIEKCERGERKLFLAGGLFLSLLTGVLIPSSVIKAAPLDFIVITEFYNPLWFVVSSFCLALGIFVIWTGVFYFLAKPELRIYFDRGIWYLSGIFVVDYMFFGRDMGLISSQLEYEKEFGFTWKEQAGNAVIVAVLVWGGYVVYRYWRKHIKDVLIVGILALLCMSTVNVVTINRAINSVKERNLEAYITTPRFTMSRTGRNVIVIMLDRALGEYIPYFFQEKPELEKQFTGFTYYANTISFGGYTNFGAPALFGGYEYTPVEMNKRDEELLVTKHNEALKVMPVLFAQNDYRVTVCDPPYAGYKVIPDLSIYDEYPDIQSYVLDGKFSEDYGNGQTIENNHRNFFCYSILKTVPLCIQKTVYDYGKYNQAESGISLDTKQIGQGMFRSIGLEATFMNNYNVLAALPTITDAVDENINTFLMMANGTTHDPMLLQEPEYVPAMEVDNTEYESSHQERYTVNGRTLRMEMDIQLTTYQANMAALLQLGKWFDYMRENAVYDNTRIIIVADHGRGTLFEEDEHRLGESDILSYYPLLMVKDFNDKTFETSEEFMTNGDVPTLAMKDIIKNPVNPFTGKAIDNSEKTAHDQYVIFSKELDVEKNNGTVYLPAKWYSVHDDMRDVDNWKLVSEDEVIFPIMEE
ncbi:MAG: membrane protein insertase YidC [Lachnospiraceae bacterium]|jgi:YidC/Oxa1 family membrane protein insertase|nr:membrane protein insertase YidC [Lachnospiraceae bacterium]